MMKAAQLRQAILQAAVQGKLVPQASHDEPASMLLERIKAEKARFIKSGELRKEKPLPPIIEDEIPYDLPEGWNWTKLGEITRKIHYGYTASAAPKGNAKLLRITDIQNNNVHWQNVPYCAIESNRLNDYQLNDNDILIARTGGTIGKTYLVAKISHIAVFASYLIRVVPFSYYDIKYLKYFLESPLYWEQLHEKSMGTGQPNVNGVSLSNLIIPLPPLAEQQRIVIRVEELMTMCDELEAAEKELDILEKDFADNLPKSILQAAVQGKLVRQNIHDEPASVLLGRIRAEKAKLVKEGKLKNEKPLPQINEDEIPFDIPNNWVWSRLGDIFYVRSSRRVHESDWKSTGIPFYRAREIATLAKYGKVDNDLYISKDLFEEFKKSGVPEPGDLMVTAVGTLGKTYIVKEGDVFYYKDASVISFNNFGKLNPDYFKYLMTSPFMTDQIKADSSGTTVGTLTIVRANNYYAPLPPLAEQERIVAKIKELLLLCGELEKVEESALIIPEREKIIKLSGQRSDEPLQMAARGSAGQKSEKHQQAIDDMFSDD